MITGISKSQLLISDWILSYPNRITVDTALGIYGQHYNNFEGEYLHDFIRQIFFISDKMYGESFASEGKHQ